jgi:DNA-binding transcriptional MerR regulator
MPFSIGEFSRITSLSVKTLRLYHEKGLLPPAAVDEFTGYRSYGESDIDRARTIRILKDFDFSLAEIRGILDEFEDDEDILDRLSVKLGEVRAKISRYEVVSRSIEQLIRMERENAMTASAFEVEEKDLDTLLIAGIRMKGRYGDMGPVFGQLARKLGPALAGKAMALYYDGEYREDDADFEPCYPVRRGRDREGVSVRELPGGRAVTLIHKGPYDSLGASYRRLFDHIHAKGYEPQLPSREVYLKGPGMVFRGNPRNYLTEIQVPVREGKAA